MAITAYTGVMGSGKTYEVVAQVVVPAILSGRRVVTNIAGLDQMEVHAFCLEHRGGNPGSLGSILLVTNHEVSESGFFPHNGSEAIVQAGDIVIIDECWRHWGSDSKISPEHLHFFREHRHYTNEATGVSCDLVVISQDIADINRKLKSVIELSFRAKKLKTLGLNSAYAVEMWEGPKQRRKSVSSQTRRYDKRVYPLYSSYSLGSGPGRELQTDSRQNVLMSWRFLVLMPLMFCVMIGGMWYSISFFTSSPKPSTSSVQPSRIASTVEASEPLLREASLQPLAPDRLRSRPAAPDREPDLSSEWRLAGYVSNGPRRMVILINAQGRLRYERTSDFTFVEGLPISGTVDGSRVTSWSGALPGGSSAPGRNDLGNFPSMFAGNEP